MKLDNLETKNTNNAHFYSCHDAYHFIEEKKEKIKIQVENVDATPLDISK